MNWFKRIFTRRIEIIIKSSAYSSIQTVDGKTFTINIYPKETDDLKSVLAHELGHFMDSMAGKMTNDLAADYASIFLGGPVKLSVLRYEASAWRNAQQIYPKIDKKYVKKAFFTYTKSFKPRL